MNEVDDAILEFFEELGEVGGTRVSLPPSPVKYHLVDELRSLERERSTFSRRMSKLAEHGLLEITEEDGSYYRITDKGLAYLAGELEASELKD
jgi:DNA-binding transcriptional ArsR family regulator